MLCDNCQQHEATIHLTQVVDDQSREIHLCEHCAEESGMNLQSVMSIPELLFGMGQTEPAGADNSKARGKSCPHCHLRGQDFKKNGRLGCPHCYETFEEELSPMLAAMHKGTRHTGKVPESVQKGLAVASRRDELKRKLEVAIREERYEEAALLRDQLREDGHDPQ